MAKATFSHHVQSISQRFVSTNGLRLADHHLRKYGRIRVKTGRQNLVECIALGENPDDLLVFKNEQRADFILGHQPAGGANGHRLVSRNQIALGKNILNKPFGHDCLLYCLWVKTQFKFGTKFSLLAPYCDLMTITAMTTKMITIPINSMFTASLQGEKFRV
jgi:hypothetical protein